MTPTPTTPFQTEVNEESFDYKSNRFYQTIYKSDAGVFFDEHMRGGSRDMVSVAVRIQANHETHHVKVDIKFILNVTLCNPDFDILDYKSSRRCK